jgi:hypothetical protein
MRLRLAPSIVSARSNISTLDWPHTRTPEIGYSDASRDIEHIIRHVVSPYTISLDQTGLSQADSGEYTQNAPPSNPSGVDTFPVEKDHETTDPKGDLRKINFTIDGKTLQVYGEEGILLNFQFSLEKMPKLCSLI